MGQVVLNTLYKNTQLQDTFGVILLALVNQQPKVLNLKEYLRHFILFRKEVVTLRTEYDLKKAREKEHVLEGLKIALDNLDAVVKLIRDAEDPISAREGPYVNLCVVRSSSKSDSGNEIAAFDGFGAAENS